MKYQVIGRRSGCLVALLAVAVSLSGACSSATPAGAKDGQCRSFDGETVKGLRWSGLGDFLAVGTTDDDHLPRVRVFRWPGMELLSEATAETLDSDIPTMDDQGVAYWVTEDPVMTDDPGQLWRLEPGAEPTIVDVPVPRFVYGRLTWAGGTFITDVYDPGPPARSRLVEVDITQADAQALPLTAWVTRTVGEYWADPSGDWLAWDETDDVGEPQDFAIQHEGAQQRVRAPGYGGRAMTLSPDRRWVIYQRSETARLTMLNIETGRVDGELSQISTYGGEVSATGILALLTSHGPGEHNELCVLDVNARLAALAAL